MRRKTTTQKILEGDAGKRGKHVLQRKLAAEPQAQVGLPDAPEHLSARAREAWYFWREQLELMQLDYAPDAIRRPVKGRGQSRHDPAPVASSGRTIVGGMRVAV
jgi:hypothetical protein